jgi:hypothetical protein
MEDDQEGGSEQMPEDVIAFRVYVNSAKRLLLEGLETAHPTDPNQTHDLGRLDKVFAKLMNFGNALYNYFRNEGPIESVAQNHYAIFSESDLPDGLDLMELKRDRLKNKICVYIIENDIKRNTYSYRK